MEPIVFKSSRIIAAEREQLKEARKNTIEKAKSDFQKVEKRKEESKKRGYDDWMLPSVLETIDKQSSHKSKSKKSKKEKKKHKKSKKKKKHLSSDSDSDDTTEEKLMWVEKDIVQKADEAVPLLKPVLQRDDWMGFGFDALPTVSRQEIKDSKKKLKDEERKLFEQPGQHHRELNPYWKDGGVGLPEEEKKEKVSSSLPHISWLRRAYRRCEEEVKETGRTMEDVAAERWGSLKKLQSLIKKAEKIENEKRGQSYDRDSSTYHPTKSWRQSSSDFRYSEDRNRRSKYFLDPSKSYQTKSDYQRMFKRPSDSPPPVERSDDSNVLPSESRHSHSRSNYDAGQRDNSGLNRDKYGRHSNRESGTAYVPTWKKKTASSEEQTEKLRVAHSMDEEKNRKNTTKKTSDSSSSSSSSESDSPEIREEEEEEEERPPSPVILTEDQMNDLSAKILRAELMGDDELVESLQNKLKAAQKAKADSSTTKIKQASKDQQEVLLTHIDHNGMAWPLLDKEERMPQGKQRKKNIKTHGSTGERLQYFDDDDKYDLKKLVQREKMSSAEDQNSMFSRLAGSSVEKTDEDYQIDDIFVSRAAQKDSEAKTFDLQKARAIFEHKKMSSAIENCKLCFEKVAKHLLVSIGQKSYICLPDGPSLTEGHCLIIPIQHITSSTAMDEDVWQEIQNFKKALVKMFSHLGKDTIFMETSMHLNKFPHACIDCVPLERDDGMMAPMYFKKAILESESEWCMNKKLVDISKKDIRRSIPKGFPYFSVNFGLDGGFAHAIEDEKKFSFYFGKEIIGGLIDADHSLFRRPQKEQFEVQRQKVLRFAKMWKSYDFTQNE